MVKNFLFAIIFMGLTMYLGYVLYDRGGDFDWLGGDDEDSAEGELGVEAGVALSFPDEIEIIRSDGSRLDVRLTARNASFIQFQRLTDGADFTYAIDQLDAATVQRILRYPDSGLSNSDELLRSGELTLEDTYVEQLREAVAEIDAKIDTLEREYSASRSKTERLTLRRQAEKLDTERKSLESKIAERSGG